LEHRVAPQVEHIEVDVVDPRPEHAGANVELFGRVRDAIQPANVPGEYFFEGDEEEFQRFIAGLGEQQELPPAIPEPIEEPNAVVPNMDEFFVGDDEQFEAFIAGLGVEVKSVHANEDENGRASNNQDGIEFSDKNSERAEAFVEQGVVAPVEYVGPEIYAWERIPIEFALSTSDRIKNIAVSVLEGRFLAEDLTAFRQLISSEILTWYEPLSYWRIVRGHLLLAGLAGHRGFPDEESWIISILSFGMNFLHIHYPTNDEMSAFVALSGIRSFCASNLDRVRKAILWDYGRNWSTRIVIPTFTMRGEYLVSSFLANLGEFCPDLLEASVDIKGIMMQHRAYRRVGPRQGDFNLFRMIVRRDHAFSDATYRSRSMVSANWDKLTLPWEAVTFMGEKADGDGVYRDWFFEATKELTNPDRELLKRGESGVYVLRSQKQIVQDQYRGLGRYLALAIVHGQPLGIRLSSVYYGRMIGQAPTLNDFEIEDEDMVRSLRAMLRAPENELADYEIDIDGESIVPILGNRQELVERKLMSMVARGTERLLDLMVEGFRDILPVETTRGLTVADVGAILYGNPIIDVEALIRSLQLNGHTLQDPVIGWLFDTLRAYSNEQLAEFLRFATGTPIPPVGGFSSLNPRISIVILDNVRQMPKSKTCFHQVFLPQYGSKAVLEEKLNESLANNGAMQD
jgi:hypothetical protein